MAFQVPTTLTEFYNKYPNAKAVWVLYSGRSFLNHYKDKAIKNAQLSTEKLFSVDKQLTAKQVFPELPLRKLTASVPEEVQDCICNESSIPVKSPFDAAAVEVAIQAAADEANVTLELLVVEATAEGFDITVETYDETATFQISTSSGSFELV